MSIQMNTSINWTNVATFVAQLSEQFICNECRADYTIAKTAVCGHTLCSGCWRGLRACPICSERTSPGRRTTNAPLEALTQHIRALVEAFQVLFHVKPDEYLNSVQTEPDLVNITKVLNNWIRTSQNQLSKSVIQVQVHTEDVHSHDIFTKGTLNTSKVVYKNLPQDDWDKIEVMPDSDEMCPIDKNHNQNAQETLETKTTCDEPRRSSRIRGETTAVELSSGKKSDGTNKKWSTVKRMKKEFSKLNKIKNRNKLNVSIEMVKKTKSNTTEPQCNSHEISYNIEENSPASIPCQSSNNEHSLDSIINTKTGTSHMHTSATSTSVQTSTTTANKSKVLFLKKGPLYTKQSLGVVSQPEFQSMLHTKQSIEVVSKPESQTTDHKQSETIHIDIRIGNMTANLVIDEDRDVRLNINRNAATGSNEKNAINKSSTYSPQDKAPLNIALYRAVRQESTATPTTVAIDAAPAEVAIDAPPAKIAIDIPIDKVTIDAAPPEVAINATPSEGFATASFAELASDATPSKVAIDATPSKVAINAPPAELPIDATPSEVAIDATPAEVAIDATPADLLIATPSEVAIDATPSEVAIDATPLEVAVVSPHDSESKAEETVRRSQPDKRSREPDNVLPNKKARLDTHSDTWASLNTADENAMADVCKPVRVPSPSDSVSTVSLSADSDGSVVEDTPRREVPDSTTRPTETPASITKFADDIQHKSTPLARKTLDFSEATLCPTDPVAVDSLETAFASKAFERSQKIRVPHVAGSNLKGSELNYLKLVCMHKRWVFLDKYTPDLTHLVVSVDEENKAQRTVKYMCALAAGCWVVSMAWAESCTHLTGARTTSEEPFEALDWTGADGPRRSRLSLASQRRIFSGFAFRCEPPFTLFDLATLESVLVTSGARVLRTTEEARADGDEPRILLAESDEEVMEDRFTYMALNYGVVPVNLEWVLDCLGAYTLQPLRKMLLCPTSLVLNSAGCRNWLANLVDIETQLSLPSSLSS